MTKSNTSVLCTSFRGQKSKLSLTGGKRGRGSLFAEALMERVSCFFSTFWKRLFPLAHDPASTVHFCSLWSGNCHLTFPLFDPTSSSKDPYSVSSTWITQDNLPISRFIRNPICRVCFSGEGDLGHRSGLECGYLFGGMLLYLPQTYT